MAEVAYAGESACPSCKRMVRHKPRGGPLRRHGCRLRWVARRIARARSAGWDEGYRFALRNISDPLVYADLTEYGTGWVGLIQQGGINITYLDWNKSRDWWLAKREADAKRKAAWRAAHANDEEVTS